MAKEIERKFLVKRLPPYVASSHHDNILQGYAAITADGGEVRLRRKGNSHTVTIKSGGDLERQEFETGLTPQQYGRLWPCTTGRRLAKTRYTLKQGELTFELDVYRAAHNGLVTVEVEFSTKRESLAFVPPDWFGREVTKDRRYKNQNLALHGKFRFAPNATNSRAKGT
jgi:CYTH domain-containing protein